jgi:hypothetical protein
MDWIGANCWLLQARCGSSGSIKAGSFLIRVTINIAREIFCHGVRLNICKFMVRSVPLAARYNALRNLDSSCTRSAD